MKKVYWTGTPPAKCDICQGPINTCFVDGKMRAGPWANMCLSCHKAHGVGLGTGRGQLYWLEPKGEQFSKVEG